MVKVRQDAWSHEDDLLLAETVLRHIREGSTQLNAFEEVGDKLNRTSAACGFRWNAEIRRKYDNAIDLAKRQRKEKKRAMQANNTRVNQSVVTMIQQQNYKDDSSEQVSEAIEPSITLDTVIHYLTKIKKDYYASSRSRFTLDQTQKENDLLKQEIAKLEKQLVQTEKQLETIQEDYQVFIQIMDRARKMTVLDDQGTLKAPTFRMDKNGNLEQLIQGTN